MEKDRIYEDPDYVAVRRYGHSMKKVEARYPQGCPDHIIAACLDITEERLNESYQKIIASIKTAIGV